jgi:hypothetical protein
VSASGKQKYRQLRQTPLSRVVQAELAAARRPAENAKRTDAHIRAGLHPLAAAEKTRQDAKPRRRKGWTGASRPCRVCGQATVGVGDVYAAAHCRQRWERCGPWR